MSYIHRVTLLYIAVLVGGIIIGVLGSIFDQPTPRLECSRDRGKDWVNRTGGER